MERHETNVKAPLRFSDSEYIAMHIVKWTLVACLTYQENVGGHISFLLQCYQTTRRAQELKGKNTSQEAKL